MNRIALTPLTATVLLIVFSIVLGMITLRYGGHFVEAQAVEYVDTGDIVCPAGCVSKEYAIRKNPDSDIDKKNSFGT